MEPNEDDIEQWIKEIDNRGTNRQEPKGSKITRLWDIIKFELDWNFDHYILSPIRDFRIGVSNLFRYRKIIWNDRWWDYSFFMKLMEFKLKEIEDHWGRDTHYVGDQDDKDTLKKLVKDIEWLNDDEKEEFTKEYEEEYKKRSKRFFGRLDRNHRKLWD